MSKNVYQIVFCTCPNQTVALKLANDIVSISLAACVNLVPHLTSVYSWEGKIQEDTECLLIIKTTAQHYNELEDFLSQKHPYDCPEILSIPIINGSKNYLQWIDKSLSKSF